ncbi:MAG TPA: tetratricopeptide repeat protein [Pyrinomonadaceae bacterium]|nr:tetratricopeptide repeat protein [Pyrinomonadaceae bacterium]
MSKRVLAASFLGFALLLCAVQHPTGVIAAAFDWSAVSPDDSISSTDVDDSETKTAQTPEKKNGNGFVRALGAPFRAIGKLFRGGGKKDQQQQARSLTPEEAKKFESMKVFRVNDARSSATADSSAISQPGLSTPLQRGRELLLAGDLNGAISELSIAASSGSQTGEAQNLLGVAYENKGLRQRALELFKAAVNMDKDNAEYLNNYGFLLYKNGNLEEATKQLKRAAKYSPNNSRIWNNLGLAQSQRGKFDEAYKSFVQAAGEYTGRVNIAAQLLQRGYAKDAIEHLEKAQTIQPNSTDVLNKLVSLYEMTGRHSDAETTRRSLVALKTFADAKK